MVGYWNNPAFKSFSELVSDYISSLDFSINIYPEKLDKREECFMIKTIETPKTAKTFADGGYIGEFVFEVWYRTMGNDSSDRFRALKLLEKVAIACEENPPLLPVPYRGINFKAVSFPVLRARANNGEEDYAIKIRLNYIKKGS